MRCVRNEKVDNKSLDAKEERFNTDLQNKWVEEGKCYD